MKKFLNLFMFRKGGDGYITISMLFLAFAGMFMTTSTSVGEELNVVTLGAFFIKQFGFVFAGILVMNWISNTFKFQSVEKKYLSISALMFILLLITLFSPAVNGAKAWIRLPFGMSIQPSEFFKIYVIVLLGVCVEKTRNKNYRFMQSFLPFLVFWVIGIIIIMVLQKDLGTAVVTAGIGLILLMIPYHPNFSKAQYRIILFSFIILILGMLFLTNQGLDLIIKNFGGEKASYKVFRFVAARNPFSIADSSGYQLIYGLEAIARGGFIGRGFGNSTVKFLIPEGRTDYIMAIVAEELGLVGFFMISFFMFLIIYRLIYFALKAKNESYKVILLGVALYFMLHYILNVGGISGLIPLTGVPLLMVSAGGTSLVAVFLGIGISQCVIALVKRDLAKTTLKKME